MEITREQLDGMQLKGNYLLIRPDDDFETYQMEGRETDVLVAKTAQTASQHFSVTGKVIKSPAELVYNGEKIVQMRKWYGYNDESINRRIGELKNTSVLYDVPVEVCAGQYVMFNYQQYFDAIKNGRFFTCEGVRYYFIRYDEAVCSMLEESRDKIFKMLNGYLLIEPLEIPPYSQADIDVVRLGNKLTVGKKMAFGKVRMAGCYVKGYREWPIAKDGKLPYVTMVPLDVIKMPSMTPEKVMEQLNQQGFMFIESGHADVKELSFIVCYDPRFATNVEYELHMRLTKNKSYRIHRKDIYFVTDAASFDMQAIIHNFVK